VTDHRISAVTMTHYRLPLDPPFLASWDTQPRRQFDATLVRVETDSGLVGHGSGDLMLGFAGHEALFVGQDAMAIERHHRVLSNLAFHYGRCWPLDLALWDLAGRITGQPCWKLLGGASRRVRAYASSGVLREPAAMAEAAEGYLAEGFTALKIRFRRGDWRDDIRALEAVRGRLGDRLTLMVDCNQGWRMPWDTEPPWTLKDAVPVGRELERLGVYWMEEPLHRADYEGMRALRESLDVRIAGGEMTRELSDFRELAVRGCLDVLQPDAALVGGVTGLRRVAHLAEAHGLVFTPHTWTNGLGLVANAHLVAGLGAAPFLEFPYDPPQWSLARRDFLMDEPIVASDGWIDLSDAPGMGVSIDHRAIEPYRIG
jgi:L-alanine-DL-glutamate epimerase-like enolase superfamily enzyme